MWTARHPDGFTQRTKEIEMPNLKLSDLSDSQLGNLIRTGVSESVILTSIESGARAKARKAKRRRKENKRFNLEREKRAGMTEVAGFQSYGLTVPALTIAAETWDELVPTQVLDAYKAVRKCSHSPVLKYETITWRMLHAIHLLENARKGPDPLGVKGPRMVAALMEVAGITEAEARQRIADVQS